MRSEAVLRPSSRNWSRAVRSLAAAVSRRRRARAALLSESASTLCREKRRRIVAVHRLGRDIVTLERIEGEQVAGEQEFGDLPPAVLHQADGADGAAHHAVAVQRGVTLAEDLAVLLGGDRGPEAVEQVERIRGDAAQRCRRDGAGEKRDALLQPVHDRFLRTIYVVLSFTTRVTAPKFGGSRTGGCVRPMESAQISPADAAMTPTAAWHRGRGLRGVGMHPAGWPGSARPVGGRVAWIAGGRAVSARPFARGGSAAGARIAGSGDRAGNARRPVRGRMLPRADSGAAPAADVAVCRRGFRGRRRHAAGRARPAAGPRARRAQSRIGASRGDRCLVGGCDHRNRPRRTDRVLERRCRAAVPATPPRRRSAARSSCWYRRVTRRRYQEWSPGSVTAGSSITRPRGSARVGGLSMSR